MEDVQFPFPPKTPLPLAERSRSYAGGVYAFLFRYRYINRVLKTRFYAGEAYSGSNCAIIAFLRM
jgi:hypothetical protein